MSFLIPTLNVPTINVGSDLKTFLIQNNVLTTMFAVTVAFSTGTMIRSLVSDIILPSIYTLFISRLSPLSTALSGAFAPINHLNLDNFLKEILSWIVVIFIAFIFIEYFIRRYLFKITPITNEQKIITPEVQPMKPLPSFAPVNSKISNMEKNNQGSSNIAGAIVTDDFTQPSPWNW